MIRLFSHTMSSEHIRTLLHASNKTQVRLASESCTRYRSESCIMQRTTAITLYSLEILYISQWDSFTLYEPGPKIPRLERILLLSVTFHVSRRNKLIWRERKIFDASLFLLRPGIFYDCMDCFSSNFQWILATKSIVQASIVLNTLFQKTMISTFY